MSVELRTVNHRFLDLHIRLPREYSFLEPEIQRIVKGALSRGRVDINVTVQSKRTNEVELVQETARSFVEAAKQLGQEFQLGESLDLKTLLSLPGVIRPKDSSESREADGDLLALVLESLGRALEGALAMRTLEGGVLEDDFRSRLASIAHHLSRIQSLAPDLVLEYRTKLEARLSQLLPQNGLDMGRIAQEVALIADKCDVSEEVVRLESHIRQFSEWLHSGSEVGKRMDFLLQEMHREINTILSKTENLEVTKSAIEIKAEIEKLREQAQNIE